MSRDAVQARRPLNGALVPVLCAQAPGTVVHTTDFGNATKAAFADEVTLILENLLAGAELATITITGGAPLVVSVPAQSTLEVLVGQPIMAQPDGTARAVTVAAANLNAIVAFGWFQRG